MVQPNEVTRLIGRISFHLLPAVIYPFEDRVSDIEHVEC